MTLESITDSLRILRVDDTRTRFFEALWEIPEGVTYNAYLLDTGEGLVLFDGWKSSYASELLSILQGLIDPEDLRYIVVHHMEPDHTGSLPLVASWARGAEILGHPMVGRMLPRGLAERFRAVKDGSELRLGGHTLRFIHTPWVHWPETMFTYLPEEGVLLTCDAFGSYGTPTAVFEDECRDISWYLRLTRKYLVTVVGSYRGFIVKAVEKLSSLGVEPRVIAPGHGLVWRREPGRVVEYYRKVALAEAEPGKAVLVYASMYGNTERAARALARLLSRRGYRVAMYGFTDASRPLISEVLADVIDAELLVIAAPTYEAGLFPLAEYLAEIICEKASAKKKLAVLASYSWGGIAAKRLKEILGGCGYQPIAENEEKRLHTTYEEALKAAEGLAESLEGSLL